MPQALQYNSSIEKAMDNLRAMGLKVELLTEGENRVFIFIHLDSIVRMIDRRIPYKNHKIKIEQPFMVIDAWRGEQ
jgi:hypothetical protein